MKLSHITAFAIAAVISASAVSAPAHAGILDDIVGAPGKVIGKATGASAAGAAAAAGKLQREQAARRERVRGSQSAWMGEKEYVACLKKHTSRECNISYFGVPVVK